MQCKSINWGLYNGEHWSLMDCLSVQKSYIYFFYNLFDKTIRPAELNKAILLRSRIELIEFVMRRFASEILVSREFSSSSFIFLFLWQFFQSDCTLWSHE